jgi:hypothetical protein
VGRRLKALLAALSLALGLSAPAHAHKPSDSYLQIALADDRISGQWDIALRDLDFAIGLDADGNGDLTWGEVRAKHAEIAAYALARLVIRGDNSPCTIEPGAQQVDDHTDGTYTVLPLAIHCPHTPARLTITYTLFADLDPQHRGLLNLQAQGQTRTAVLGPQAPTQTFELERSGRWDQLAAYAQEGVRHIWVGFDHILFLLSLLLPAVLLWQERRWRPVQTFREAFVDVFKIVTAFTLAHSITLSLATLGFISLPTRWVETLIAATVVMAALNNVWPLFRGRRWMVAFGFGLIHGFGFASVLIDLRLPRGALALALLGFNLGVEGGQLAIVVLFLPLAFALRETRFYRRAAMFGGSLVIAALAAVWLVERALQIKLVVF